MENVKISCVNLSLLRAEKPPFGNPSKEQPQNEQDCSNASIRNDGSSTEDCDYENDDQEFKVEESCKVENNVMMGNYGVQIESFANFKKKYLIRLAPLHNNGKFVKFQCKTCSQSFSNKKWFDKHQKTHLLVKRFKCKKCGDEFLLRKDLDKHRYSHAVKKRPLLPEYEPSNVLCEQCGVEVHVEKLRAHREKFHSGVEVLTRREKKRIRRMRKVLCDVCGRYCNHGGFTRHMKSHLGIQPPRGNGNNEWKKRPYLCEICGLCLTYSGRNTHKLTHNPKKFNCEVCGSSFAQKSEFKRHQFMHTGIKPFQCDECGKCFAKKEYLTLHNRTHTGEKPLKCEFCGKAFARLSALRGHQRSHIGKPHGCEECGKCFRLLDDLVDHKRVHNIPRPFECDICKKCFRTKLNLQTHIVKIHLQKKRFVCEVCGKNFDEIDALIAHEQWHTVGKPHACQVCNMKFKTVEYLTKHEQKHKFYKSEDWKSPSI